jgi:hypothetical protein
MPQYKISEFLSFLTLSCFIFFLCAIKLILLIAHDQCADRARVDTPDDDPCETETCRVVVE